MREAKRVRKENIEKKSEDNMFLVKRIAAATSENESKELRELLAIGKKELNDLLSQDKEMSRKPRIEKPAPTPNGFNPKTPTEKPFVPSKMFLISAKYDFEGEFKKENNAFLLGALNKICKKVFDMRVNHETKIATLRLLAGDQEILKNSLNEIEGLTVKEIKEDEVREHSAP